jgi:uncharacterized protein
MWYNILGRTGLRVSALACGSNALRQYNQHTADLVFNYALDRGITLIETGRMYADGETETWIGNAISKRRSEYVLASKCLGRHSYDEAARDLDASLEALGTDHIDNYRLAPVDDLETLTKALQPSGALRALEDAREEGKISHTGLTGHVAEVLIKALETDRFDTVLFVLNMASYAEPVERLIETAKRHRVGTMVMRPLDHGALSPARALRFALSTEVDTVLCGMYSPLEVDRNLAVANAEPTRAERDALVKEARRLSSGCLRCRGNGADLPCNCPKGIDVRLIMLMSRFRAEYGLLSNAEFQWSTAAESAKACDECGDCVEGCVAGLDILPYVHGAAAERGDA